MVEIDEFDEGPRNVFNYGHTFGHAIESVTDYRVPHGIAISFGMDIANHISAQMGYIAPELRWEIRPLLQKIWGDVRLSGIDLERYKQVLLKDKKAVGGELRCILTRGLGDMFKSPLELNDEATGWIAECFKAYA